MRTVTRAIAPADNPELYVTALLKRQRRIPLTPGETAILLGMSGEGVRQAKRRAMAKLRACVKREGVTDPLWREPDRTTGILTNGERK